MRRGARWVTVLLVLVVLLLPGCDASATPTVQRTPSPVPRKALYLATDGGMLAALDATTGQQRWALPLGAAARIVAGTDALLYAAADDTIVALRVVDGARVWTERTGAVSYATLTGRTLVLLSASGDAAGIHALDAATGVARWRHPAAPDDTIAVDGTLVYVAHNTQTPVDGPTDGFLFALRLADGSEAWRFETGGETLGTPAVAGGAVYAPSSSGLFALDTATGARRWYAATGPYNGVPALVDRDVYVATASAVLGVSPWDGHGLWRVETRNEIVHTSLVGGVLYLATYNRLLALDAATGAQRWAFAGAGPLAVLSVRGAAYVADGADVLHTLDAETGRELWHIAGMAPVAASVTMAYAVRGGDTLVALAADDGAALWSYRATGEIQPPVATI